LGVKAGDATGKHLVIVESPSKAKTINKYLGGDYLVLASVGHVRDLPEKAKKGEKRPVPGVDLEHRFQPSYEVLPGKEQVIKELKRAAGESLSSGREVWFATDLDREGEAIAWHLAEELGIDPTHAKRVVFPAITKGEIERAFSTPHPIDLDKVNAQQARRILDRIVGYQVSPLLWKKVARGLSAGRVQSVAVRVIVEREREIRSFVPEEYWEIGANFALSEAKARELGPKWRALLAERDDKGAGPTLKAQNAWLAEHGVVRAELVEIDGKKFEIGSGGGDVDAWPDLTSKVRAIVEACGLKNVRTSVREDARAKGPARWVRTIEGEADAGKAFEIVSIETKRTSVRPPAPFITSTLQQGASSRLGFAAQRTMRTAQQLYEGVDIPGEGPVGLITYMRTDSTHLSGEALSMVREHVAKTYGDRYLPEKPNFFSSSTKAAQEAHEAIRPASMAYPPNRVKSALTNDQFRLYSLIWERFVACQMTPAEWDSTSAMIETAGASSGAGSIKRLTFRATGRVLAFDGFYKVAGVPVSDSTQTLPKIAEKQKLHAVSIEPTQKFTSPPSRFSEASLIKTLEAEGIGRPSTYASIIQTIQDRKYVEQISRAFHATDLGEVVTDKLVEAFPRIMDIGYTREMEGELDKVEDEHLDWIDMLRRFYGPFKQSLERAHEELSHAKAELVPAPEEYRCEKCGSSLVYRFGRNGRFLSCSTYPECNYACPCDREGRPMLAQFVNIRCPRTGRPMVLKNGRFGPFLTTALSEGMTPDDGIILNLDKKRHVTAPSPPPLETDLPCPTCQSPLNLRDGVRGPWLGCSRFPKCRGRGKWTELPEKQREDLEKRLAAHSREHPIPTISTLDGRALTDAKGKPLPDAPTVDDLMIDAERAEELAGGKRPVRTPAGSAA
jgi:DNA topoisomerase-1